MTGEERYEARINLAITLLDEIESRYKGLDIPQDSTARQVLNARFAGFSSAKALRIRNILSGCEDMLLEREVELYFAQAGKR